MVRSVAAARRVDKSAGSEGAPDAAAEGALSDLRVVDMATVIAGPGAAKLFADLGADVIKVESPSGDSVRRMGWMPPPPANSRNAAPAGADSDGEAPGGAGSDGVAPEGAGSAGAGSEGAGSEGAGSDGSSPSEDSYFWKLQGRGKRCVVLDLKSDPGRDTMLRLLDTADLLIENMRPGKLEALGLAPELLTERNKRLVILRITGFGQSGPYAMRPGFATLAEALSGYSAISGSPDGPPLLPPVALTDELTGTIGAFAALAAVWEARRSGHGQVIDLSLVDSLLHVMGPLPSAWAHLGYLQPRLGAGIPYTVPRGTYECSDGRWIAISTSSDSVAQRVLALIGAGGDERFASFSGRFANRDELEGLVADWVSGHTSEEAMRQLNEADAAVSPVYTMAELIEDEHFKQRETFIEVDGVLMQSVAPRFSRTPGQVKFAGRALGADTAEVLASLGVVEEPLTSCSGGGAESGDDGESGAESGDGAEDAAESGDGAEAESEDGAESESESGSGTASDLGRPQAQQARKG